MANIGGSASIAPTPGATVTITLNTDVHTMVASWTAGQAETVNLSGTQKAGQHLVLVILNDGTIRVITLGTGLVGNGIITGIVSKTSVLSFISDGTNFYEMSRTVGI